MSEIVCRRPQDAAILLPGGRTARLGDFRGHALVLFFCPHDERAAAAEIEAYQSLAGEFERFDTWVIGLADASNAPSSMRQKPCVTVGSDPDGAVFEALKAMLNPEPLHADWDGAVFVIDRRGAVRAAWAGIGHARQALACVGELP